MNFIELQEELMLLTKRNISFSDIGEALGTGRSNISSRAKKGSNVKVFELEKIAKHFLIPLDILTKTKSLGDSIYNDNIYIIQQKLKKIGEVVDEDMESYMELSVYNIQKLHTRFRVNLNWLFDNKNNNPNEMFISEKEVIQKDDLDKRIEQKFNELLNQHGLINEQK